MNIMSNMIPGNKHITTTVLDTRAPLNIPRYR